MGATYLSASPIFHAQTKHVEVDFHFVRDKVVKKDFQVKYISTKDQLTDNIIKGLSSSQFLVLRFKLNFAFAPPSLRGRVQLQRCNLDHYSKAAHPFLSLRDIDHL